MAQQPQRTSAADWGFTRTQRPNPNESPFSPPQSIFAPTHHTPPVGYLTPLDEGAGDHSMNDGSMTGLMRAMTHWQVTTPETVRGVPDPVPTIPFSFSHQPPTERMKVSIDSQFMRQRTTSRSGASNAMEASCEGTCRFEELVDDVSMPEEQGHDSAVSAAREVSDDGNAYTDEMSSGD